MRDVFSIVLTPELNFQTLYLLFFLFDLRTLGHGIGIGIEKFCKFYAQLVLKAESIDPSLLTK